MYFHCIKSFLTNNYMNSIHNYVLVLIILIAIMLYPTHTLQWSQSSLGRFVSISLILYFTWVNKMYGLAISILVLGTSLFHDMKTGLFSTEAFSVGNQPLLFQDRTAEGFEGISDKESFRKHHCKDGKMHNKGVPVRDEMAPHVFPFLSFQKSTCNVCNENCKCTFLQKEEELTRPVDSNDWVETAMSYAKSWTSVHEQPDPVLGPKIEGFSRYSF